MIDTTCSQLYDDNFSINTNKISTDSNKLASLINN